MGKATVVTLKINEITVDDQISIRAGLDEATVRRYAEIIDILPPIIVYNVEQGTYLLAEGFHRVAAAVLAGSSEIRAVIRNGTRQDALEFAAVANARHGRPLTDDELKAAWARLRDLHPDWSLRRLGRALGIAHSTIDLWQREEEVIQAVPDAAELSAGVLQAIRSAPEERWPALVGMAKEAGWSPAETRAAAHIAADANATPEFVEALLDGRAEPFVEQGGEPAVLAETVARRLADAAAADNKPAMWRLLSTLTAVGHWTPERLVRGLDIGDLAHVEEELPRAITYLQAVLAAAGAARHRFTVIRGGRPEHGK